MNHPYGSLTSFLVFSISVCLKSYKHDFGLIVAVWLMLKSMVILFCDQGNLGLDYSNDRGQRPTFFSISEYENLVKN